jgi:hypothetical protein
MVVIEKSACVARYAVLFEGRGGGEHDKLVSILIDETRECDAFVSTVTPSWC